jgi:hypothetical protein
MLVTKGALRQIARGAAPASTDFRAKSISASAVLELQHRRVRQSPFATFPVPLDPRKMEWRRAAMPCQVV